MRLEVKLSVADFEKLIADSPSLSELYLKLVSGVVETSGEDEAAVKALVANLMISSLTEAK